MYWLGDNHESHYMGIYFIPKFDYAIIHKIHLLAVCHLIIQCLSNIKFFLQLPLGKVVTLRRWKMFIPLRFKEGSKVMPSFADRGVVFIKCLAVIEHES